MWYATIFNTIYSNYANTKIINAGESRQDFINRCMGDKTMEAEYTDNEQRLAVCNTSYDSKENVDAVETQQDDTEDQKYIRNVQETEDSYVIEFGKSMPEENQEEEQEKQDTLDVEPEYVEIQTEIKAYHDDEEKNAEEGMFEGYGSVFNNTDLGNDVIRTGAFKKSKNVDLKVLNCYINTNQICLLVYLTKSKKINMDLRLKGDSRFKDSSWQRCI